MTGGLARFTGAPGPATPTPDGLPGPLRRLVTPRAAPPPGEACELCGVPVGDEHRHVVDLEGRGMLCSCRGCALLFIEAGAAGGRYRTVPEDYRRVVPFHLSPTQWAAIQIPVGIAFVVRNSRLDETVAFYPSPGGATESELPLDAWDEIVTANPVLADVEEDVEAVLVRTDRDAPGRPDSTPDEPECFIVPVDRCYELVGALRLHWRGFDGGQQARAAIDEFFTDVTTRAKVVSHDR